MASIPMDKVQQFFVQFACKTPTHRELTLGEQKALEDVLREKDRSQERFQLFPEISEQGVRAYQIACQFNVKDITVTAPSLTITNNSITLHHPIRLGDKTFTRDRDFDSNYLNKPMCADLFEIQKTLPWLRYNRAGKIFEFMIGPFDAAKKDKLLHGVISSKLQDVSAIQLNFTRILNKGEDTYNILTVLQVRQQELKEPFLLGIRCDINNKNLADSLEPRDIEKVWGTGDAVIWDHLESVLDFSEG